MFATYHFQLRYLDIEKFCLIQNQTVTRYTIENRRLINQIKSYQLPVTRAIFERINADNVKEYYIFDFTGRRFIIRDTLNRAFTSQELIEWIHVLESRMKITHGDFVRVYTIKTSRTFRDVVTDQETYFLNYLYTLIDNRCPELFINFKRSW